MERILIDTDNTMGKPFWWNDDGLSILYTMGCGRFDILGVTTVFGNSSLKNVHRYTEELLSAVGRADIPVRRGARSAGDINTDAAAFLADTARAHPGEITVLALGPLTNLLGASLVDPGFFRNLKGIVLMGGITEEYLRIGRMMIRDVNLRRDLDAARSVIASGCPVTVINCHICEQVPFTREQLGAVSFWPGSILDLLEKEFWIHGKVHGLDCIFIWDVLVPVFLTDPDLFTDREVLVDASSVDAVRDGRLRIVTENGCPIHMPDRITDLARFSETVIEAWRRLDDAVKRKNGDYRFPRAGKGKSVLVKAALALFIPLAIRLMYRKRGRLYYER